jgi:hypothetical protein
MILLNTRNKLIRTYQVSPPENLPPAGDKAFKGKDRYSGQELEETNLFFFAGMVLNFVYVFVFGLIVYPRLFFPQYFPESWRISDAAKSFLPMGAYWGLAALDTGANVAATIGGAKTPNVLVPILDQLQIPFTLVMSYFFLGKSFSWRQIAGAVTVLAGAAVSVFGRGKIPDERLKTPNAAPETATGIIVLMVGVFMLKPLFYGAAGVYKENVFTNAKKGEKDGADMKEMMGRYKKKMDEKKKKEQAKKKQQQEEERVALLEQGGINAAENENGTGTQNNDEAKDNEELEETSPAENEQGGDQKSEEKESVDIDIWYFSQWINIFQLLLTAVAVPLTMIPGFGGERNPIKTMHYGWLCFVRSVPDITDYMGADGMKLVEKVTPTEITPDIIAQYDKDPTSVSIVPPGTYTINSDPATGGEVWKNWSEENQENYLQYNRMHSLSQQCQSGGSNLIEPHAWMSNLNMLVMLWCLANMSFTTLQLVLVKYGGASTMQLVANGLGVPLSAMWFYMATFDTSVYMEWTTEKMSNNSWFAIVGLVLVVGGLCLYYIKTSVEKAKKKKK